MRITSQPEARRKPSERGAARGAAALISLLALNRLRVSEATGANIEALAVERGHRTLVTTRKGGTAVTIPLAPRMARAIDRTCARMQKRASAWQGCDGYLCRTADCPVVELKGPPTREGTLRPLINPPYLYRVMRPNATVSGPAVNMPALQTSMYAAARYSADGPGATERPDRRT
jgi:integrase